MFGSMKPFGVVLHGVVGLTAVLANVGLSFAARNTLLDGGVGAVRWVQGDEPTLVRDSDSEPVLNERGGEPTGACCFPFSGCSPDLTASDCALAGGEYFGDGTTCADCTGACCKPDDSCETLTSSACVAIPGATYFGQLTDCPADGSCAEGACCFPSVDGIGNCFGPIDPINCAFSHGQHQGGGSDCATSTCPLFGGGCCLNFGGCIVETGEVCLEFFGGDFLGEGVPCPAPGDPCEAPTATGACCTDESCTVTTEAACSGVYKGDGTTCPAPDQCPCLTNAECDDSDVCNGSEACVGGVCTSGDAPTCDDGDVCTADGCDSASGCTHTPVAECCRTDAECDDNDVCTGEESCVGNVCEPGTPLNCDDGNVCTDDECDPDLGCFHATIDGCCLSNADCNDEVDCTADTCDPETHTCTNEPQDALCPDDGLFCNGVVTCDPLTDCQGGTPPCDPSSTMPHCNEELDRCECHETNECDDELFCNGQETCSFFDKICMPGNPPCTFGFVGCDEEADECIVCTSNDHCDNGDFCDGAESCFDGDCRGGDAPCVGACDEELDLCPCTTDTDCDDEDVCTGIERCISNACQPGSPLNCIDGNECTFDDCDAVDGCDHPPIPGCCFTDADCDDGADCTADTCDVATHTCLYQPDDSLCPDDGLFCTGVERCEPHVGCHPDYPCDVLGTLPHCNEELDRCECHEDAECSDFVFCNGEERCIYGGCTESDGPPCSPDHCDEDEDRCRCLSDAECDNGLFCDGEEVCDQDGVCVTAPFSEPCAPDTECDEVSDVCRCTLDAQCDDGSFCSGQETCLDGICVFGEDPCQPPNDLCIEPIGCTHSCATDEDCDDGVFCNGAETCGGFPDFNCLPGEDPCPDQGCDESRAICIEPCVSDADCPDNGKFCDGSEICLDGDCVSQGSPCEADEICDEELNICLDPCEIDAECDNGLFCDGTEHCTNGFCFNGLPPCVETLGCDEIADNCIMPCVVDAECQDGLFCNGAEECITGSCVAGEPPCADQVCHEDTDCCGEVPCCRTDEDCTDHDLCTGLERCVGQICQPGTPLNCDDGHECTVDECDPTDGCSHTALEDCCETDADCDDGIDCTLDRCDVENAFCANEPQNSLCPDDGLFCTGTEECLAFFGCSATPPCIFDEENPFCNEELDRCMACPDPPIGCPCRTNDECDDGIFCNGAEVCAFPGTCAHVPGSEPCPPTAPCDENAEECRCELDIDCDDSDFCTGEERCIDGACFPGEFPCSPPDDFCHPILGCTHSCATDDDCDDGLFCNGVETCPGFPDFNCFPGEAPCGSETAGCDEATDSCLTCSTDADCDDGVFCNGPEQCVSNLCTASAPPCDSLGLACDEVREMCRAPCTVHSECDDGLFCNGPEACIEGDCLAGESPCGNADFCDESLDTCGTTTCGNGVCGAPDEDCETCPEDCPCTPGLTCDRGGCVECLDENDCIDADLCNGTEECVLGTCRPGTSLDCNDHDPCTADGCDPLTGCTHTPVNCDDGDACTVDSCDSVLGCRHTPIVCDDGDSCTNDGCIGGVCVNVSIDCNDDDACTFDACDPAVGCVNLAINCDDGNPCTVDTCDVNTGCSSSPNPFPALCNDGDACTILDTCSGGVCGGIPQTCDDGLFCNGFEGCDPALGCQGGLPPCIGQSCNEATDSCGGVPCSAIKDFGAKCSGNGKLKVNVKLETKDFDGQTVTVTVDGVAHVLTIENKKVRLTLEAQSLGNHTVELTDPADCRDPLTVNCS